MNLRNRVHVTVLSFFFSLIATNKLPAQDSLANGDFFSKAVENTKAVYHKSFGDYRAVFNGRLYNGYTVKFEEGTPFFYSEKPGLGSVTYDGIDYDSVLLQYDEVADVVIIINNAAKIELDQSKISSFKLFNSLFVPLKKDSSEQSGKFYNLIYKGNLHLVNRQEKWKQEKYVSTNEIQYYLETKEAYCIIKDGHWHMINSKKSFFNILGNRKAELKKFVRSKKLNYRKDRQNMLVQTIAYYETLK